MASDSIIRTSGPSPRIFEQIAPQSWEHPADRAALQTLRALPGFDLVVKRTIGFFGEAGIRSAFQANAVRVGPRQYPMLDGLKGEVQRTLDWPDEIPLFVSQAPWFNAGAYGVERPFIVLQSATLDLLEPDELRAVIAHEVGHVMSGHVLYRTLLALILSFGVKRLPFLTGIALLPISLALQEWYRKSELSSDRAALLACPEIDHSLSLFMKAAGGTVTRRNELNLDAYKEQVVDYQSQLGVDTFFKLLNLLNQTHPFHTLRAAELLKWSESEDYRAIIAGRYRKRGEEAPAGQYGSDVSQAASYYAGEAREKASELSDAAKVVAQQASAQVQQAAQEVKEVLKAATDGAATRISEVFRRKGKGKTDEG